ncbi:unnamed protein product [Echinostoma caproni]|uniref:Uncharacterized protein n=1 Tax=Echinostoma caproni TaxID=27848 RepID=A0A183AZ78_9TREM|nr:unnamed protein product [Echinostoma caproni]
MNTTAGLLDPPLGRCRLSIAQFFALLAALPVTTGIQEAMVKDGVLKTLMNLFELYPLNTLLHQAVRDFLVALFTHARVIENASRSNQTTTKATDEVNPTATVELSSAPEKTKCSGLPNPVTGASTPSIAKNQSDTAAPNPTSMIGKTGGSDRMEMDTTEVAFGESTKTNPNEPITTCLDESFRVILRDHLFTDWCLRLSPLPKERLTSDPDPETAPVRLSVRHPKPGYSGHLWQLANLIQDARSGPRSEWVNELLQGLNPSSLKAWDDFAQGDLAVINKEHIPDVSFTSLPAYLH